MDLRKLSSFLAVVEEKHYGRAASRLFLPPAAVTQHVQQLERDFGTRLLDRGSGPVVPTVAGRRLVSHARTLLAATNAAVEDVTEAALGPPRGVGALRVGVMGHGSALADAAGTGVRLADVIDLPYLQLPPHTPRNVTDYLYFETAERRAPDCALTPQDILTSVAAGRGAGSGLASFARYYRWPGARYVPVLDAPRAHSVLATRTTDTNPEVRIFRALTVALAREMGADAG